MKWFLSILFIFTAFFEATVFSVPLWIPLLLFLVIVYRPEIVFGSALIGGVILDILLSRPLGLTGLFCLCVALLCFAYEKKYQIRSLTFILIASMLLCVVYCLVFAVPTLVLKTIFVGLFSLLIYFIYLTAKLNNWI